MLIEREIEIERPVEAVFDFVVDSRNDPRWCSKVQSVELLAGDGPGPGARYRVIHRPIPLRPARTLEVRCLAADRPGRIEWHEDDGVDTFDVVYEIEAAGPRRTRIRQRSDAELGTSRLMRPVIKWGIGADLKRQLRALKTVLESG